MSEQVSSLCRSRFFQLRQIRTIRRSLTSDSTKTLVNAFVNSRLDYCNSLLYGVGEGLMDRRQEIRPHHTDNDGSALVADSTAGDIQGGHPGLQMSPWLRSRLPRQWLRRCFVDSWSSVFAFGGASGIDCTADENNDFRSACLSCVWTKGLELITMHTEIARTVL